MTESDDNPTSTRPISVAELLAKNGTIGAPVSGRRRRRRGNSDAVTVAELTGEIPVIKVHSYGPDADDAAADDDAAEDAVAEVAHAPEAEAAGADADEAEADVDAEPVDLDAEPEHPVDLSKAPKPPVGAEQMSPDPVDEEGVVADDDDADLLALSGAQPALKLDELDEIEDRHHRASLSPGSGYAELFGGHTGSAVVDEHDEHDDHDVPDTTAPAGSPLLRGAWVVGQSIVAVVFGAGMFFAFDQLWRWNMIVALVLSVLVILGLVVGVRVVRKSDDLASTLTAVVVGALVTFGPLALLTAQ
jgi:hypothetical protein